MNQEIQRWDTIFLKSIKNSQRKYQERKQEAQERKEYIKKGVAHFKTIEAKLYKVTLNNGFRFGIGIDKENYAAYCACSPKDTWSNKIAKGLIGSRFLEDRIEGLLMYEEVKNQKELVFIVAQDLIGDILAKQVGGSSGHPHESNKLMNKIKQSINSGDYNLIRSIEEIR